MTSLSDNEVSTLLVVSTTDKKTISKHAEIYYIKLEVQKNTIILEAQKNTSYSCYLFIYGIICMKIFEWKCDQLFQELLNHGTIFHGKNSCCSMLIEYLRMNLFIARCLVIYQNYIIIIYY